MIACMAPVLDETVYHFCTVGDEALLAQAIAAFREQEGLSLIVPEAVARAHGLATGPPMRRITLTVNSALDGVGLTAAVATALAEADVSCNMVAACRHDHAFVPAGQAGQALAILKGLARQWGKEHP